MKIFHVTEVLSVYNDFSGIPDHVLHDAATRGTRVHKLAEAYANGLFVGMPDDQKVVGHFLSFQKWFDQYVKEVLLVERQLTDDVFGFCGRLDFGFELTDGRKVICDLKTPVVESPTWRAQTAAYLYLANNQTPHRFDGTMALQTRADGKAARGLVYEYQADDLAAFMSALSAYRYFKG